MGPNPLAGFTYLFVFLLLFMMISSGLALYRVSASVTSPFRVFRFLLPLWGGAQTARWFHHVGMWLILAFAHGTRREGLTTQPRDFTSDAWRRTATPRRIFFAVREGVAGTAMPSWKALSESEAWDLVAFLLSVGEPKGLATPSLSGRRE